MGEHVAQLDEVGPRNGNGLVVFRRITVEGRCEVGVVGNRRVAGDAVVVLHASLGRQAVVVPAHGIEHGLAVHPPEAGQGVCVGVAKDMADVERTAHGGRWCVDGEHVVARACAVEPIDGFGLPCLRPAVLDSVEGGLLGGCWHSYVP